MKSTFPDRTDTGLSRVKKTADLAAYNKAWRDSHRQKGLCVRCREPAELNGRGKPMSRCARHNRAHAARQKPSTINEGETGFASLENVTGNRKWSQCCAQTTSCTFGANTTLPLSLILLDPISPMTVLEITDLLIDLPVQIFPNLSSRERHDLR